MSRRRDSCRAQKSRVSFEGFGPWIAHAGSVRAVGWAEKKGNVYANDRATMVLDA